MRYLRNSSSTNITNEWCVKFLKIQTLNWVLHLLSTVFDCTESEVVSIMLSAKRFALCIINNTLKDDSYHVSRDRWRDLAHVWLERMKSNYTHYVLLLYHKCPTSVHQTIVLVVLLPLCSIVFFNMRAEFPPKMLLHLLFWKTPILNLIIVRALMFNLLLQLFVTLLLAPLHLRLSLLLARKYYLRSLISSYEIEIGSL